MTRDAALDELIDDLFRQAEATANSGDVQAARQIYEAVLQIDPKNARALGVLGLSTSALPPPPARDEKPAAAARPPEDAAAGPAGPPAAPPARVPFAATRTQPVVVAPPKDIPPPETGGVFRLGPPAEDAGAIPPASEPQPARPEQASVDAASEAGPLLARVHEELAQGHLLEARRLANSAASLPGGARLVTALLDEIRTHVETAARDAEALLAQGIAEFERGRMAVAMELFQQALARDPSHPVVQDYLARAEAARTGPDTESPDFGLQQEANMSQGGGPPPAAPM